MSDMLQLVVSCGEDFCESQRQAKEPLAKLDVSETGSALWIAKQQTSSLVSQFAVRFYSFRNLLDKALAFLRTAATPKLDGG